MLEEIDQDEAALNLARQTVVQEISVAPSAKRDAADLIAAVLQYRERYEAAPIRTRNRLNRELCAALGSHPKLYRFKRYDDPLVDWPELDALRLPARR